MNQDTDYGSVKFVVEGLTQKASASRLFQSIGKESKVHGTCGHNVVVRFQNMKEVLPSLVIS